jgi:para-aminobenzoate synthetase component 1
MPDMAFFFHDWVLGRTQETGEAWLSVVGRGGDRSEAAARADATASRIRAKLLAIDAEVSAERRPSSRAASLAGVPVPELARALGATAGLARGAYLDAIARAKEHIAAGDAFEICLTNALEVPFTGDPLALWRALRDANPSPFAAFLDMPEGAIVSSSPERFLALDGDGVAESRPIKGTRPRAADEAEDARLASELEASEKDRAENTMIVDLVRNDLGRVCRFGSVHVPALCAIERYPSVHQMVSTVRGRLDVGRDGIDLVRACFPPGSMTGAPKIEAMRILEDLEPVERGVYSGALGFFDVSGTLDLSVVIRTAIVREGVARVAVGGAVVADSSPAAEYDETLVKARALLEALARVRG